MSDAIQPGGIRTAGINREWAQVAAATTDGFVYDPATPTIAARESGKVDETQFAAFDQTSAVDSLTVTLAPGEAQVYGWVARDVSTDVDLAADTNEQVVYVGWDFQAVEEDRAIIGLASAFDKTTSEELPKLPLYSFDTDVNGVTSVDDLRDIGNTVHAERAYADELRARDGSTVGLGGTSLDDVGGLSNSSGIVGTDEIDAGISPTWTNRHEFTAGLVVPEDSIYDDNRTPRIEIRGDSTVVRDEVGNNQLTARSSKHTQIHASDSSPFRVLDEEIGDTGVEYVAGPTNGEFKTNNANLNLASNDIYIGSSSSVTNKTGDDVRFGLRATQMSNGYDTQFRFLNVDGDTEHMIHAGNGSPLRIDVGRENASSYVRINFGDLMISRNYGIIDLNGDQRFGIETNGTVIKTNSNRPIISSFYQNVTDLKAYGDQPIRIRDEELGRSAIKYQASSTGGTLKLGKAHLYANGSEVTDGRSNAVISLGPSKSTASKYIVFRQGNGDSPYIRSINGDIVAYDADGNATTLT